MLKVLRDVGHATRLMSLSFFLWGVGEGLWMYITPLYLGRLGASPQQTGIALAMLGIGRLLIIIPMSVVINHYNPHLVMIPNYLFGTVGIFLVAIAPTWQFTIIGFLVYGASSAALIPVSLYLALAAKQDPTRKPDTGLHTLLTFTWAANAAGMIIAPALGGMIGQEFGLRNVFAFSSLWFLFSTEAAIACPTFHTEDQPAAKHDDHHIRHNFRFISLNLLFSLTFIVGPLGYTLVSRFYEEIHLYSTNRLGLLGTLGALGITVWNLALGQRTPWGAFLGGQVLILAAFGIFMLSHMLPAVAAAYFLYAAWYTLRPIATSLVTTIIRPDQHGIAFTVLDVLYAVSSSIAPLAAGLLYSRQAEMPFIAAFVGTLVTIAFTTILMTQRNPTSHLAYNTETASD